MNRIIEAGILTKLSNDSTVNNIISGNYWILLAPNSASYPYVTLQYSAGGNVNDSPNEPIDCRYIVKCLSGNMAQARTVADAIYDALHEQELTYSATWKHFACTHLTRFEYVENVDGDKVFHCGGVYRIRADKT
jgi:hypothetical protein